MTAESQRVGPNQPETSSERAARPATGWASSMVLLAALAAALQPSRAQQVADYYNNHKHHHHLHLHLQQHHSLLKSAPPDEQQQPELQQAGERAHSSAALLAHLLQSAERRRQPADQQQQAAGFWAGADLLSLASNPEQAEQPPRAQFVAYRPLAAGSPTTPSLSRQLAPPPPFYELGLAPANALQIEPAEQAGPARPSARQQRLETSEPAERAGASELTATAAARQPEQPRSSEPEQKQPEGEQPAEAQQPATEKGVEPRQRRRLFNRILKKAEWNHLFVELSKVFLRYFLDLALKDIIGKQSGATGTDSTSSRKKLDAQSELADLLKDFVKAAISASI